jgi:hypothetical protein
MGAFVLICVGLVSCSQSDPTEYQVAAARAGRDPAAHLKLAVWCEAHGMDAHRLEHLAAALATDPQNAAARGVMGLVSYRGRWLPPEKVVEAVKADEAMTGKLARYEAKRRSAPETAAGHWVMALWCEGEGLKPEATAHLTAVTHLDPERTDAWRRLGCRMYHGRWLNAEQFAAERAEDEAQKKADRHWQPFLAKWKKELVAYSPKRELALSILGGITAPRAAPSIRQVFGHGSPDEQQIAVEMLSRIDCPASSRYLARIAMDPRFPAARGQAVETLKLRDPRDFVPELIGLMRRPLRYETLQVGPSGEPGMLIVEGARSRQKRIYRPPGSAARVLSGPGPDAADPAARTKLTAPSAYTDFSMAAFLRESPVQQLRDLVAVGRETRDIERAIQERRVARSRWGKAERAADLALHRDIGKIQVFNFRIASSNREVASILTKITGESLADDIDAWLTWWNDQIGYRYQRYEPTSKPTTMKSVPIRLKSCFAAGTAVWTLTGPRPIESLCVGDLVLGQDTATGALAYEPIVEAHHNPPDAVLRIRLKDHTLAPTQYHRFWRPGRGWAMARDLKPGDRLRTLGGWTEVVSVEPGPVQPVFNLDVARTCTFFVGSHKELVHDNSLPPAVLTPFDAEPSLAAIAGEHHGP